jgi:hypothetical protein
MRAALWLGALSLAACGVGQSTIEIALATNAVPVTVEAAAGPIELEAVSVQLGLANFEVSDGNNSFTFVLGDDADPFVAAITPVQKATIRGEQDPDTYNTLRFEFQTSTLTTDQGQSFNGILAVNALIDLDPNVAGRETTLDLLLPPVDFAVLFNVELTTVEGEVTPLELEVNLADLFANVDFAALAQAQANVILINQDNNAAALALLSDNLPGALELDVTP